MKHIFYTKVVFCALMFLGFLHMLLTGNAFHLSIVLALLVVFIVWAMLQTVHPDERQSYEVLQRLVQHPCFPDGVQAIRRRRSQ